MLLIPEGMMTLNETAAAALALVDGSRSVEQIVEALGERFDVDSQRVRTDVETLLQRLADRGLVDTV